MLNNSIYFDNSATTVPFDEVIQDLSSSYKTSFFNPSSLYKPSMIVRNKIDTCRENIAKILSCRQEDIFFTASGTDANNLAILSLKNKIKKGDIVLYSAIEHPSVINSCIELERYGANVKSIPVLQNGSLDMHEFENLLSDNVKLICIMHVNNEIGIINNIKEIVNVRDRKAKSAHIHVDGIQSFMKVPFSFGEYNVQSYSLSAHKIHGLKGLGVLACKNRLSAYRFGGGQEKGVISGTENTTGIFALNKAIEIYSNIKESSAYLRNLKLNFYNKLKSNIPSIEYIGPDPNDQLLSAPNIINISLPPLRSDVLINALDAKNIYLSSVSACSSKKQKISSVLKELKIQNILAESAVRVSFSVLNTIDEIEMAVNTITDIYNKYSKYTRR